MRFNRDWESSLVDMGRYIDRENRALVIFTEHIVWVSPHYWYVVYSMRLRVDVKVCIAVLYILAFPGLNNDLAQATLIYLRLVYMSVCWVLSVFVLEYSTCLLLGMVVHRDT